MMKATVHFSIKFSVGLILLFAIFIISMVLGAAETSIQDIWNAIFTDLKSDQINIIRELRLPREVAALIVGAALAVSGAIMQGITRNPLADPGLLGLTSGANAALAITIALLPGTNYLGITIACFIGAAIGTIMVFSIGAVKKGGLSPFRIILAGAAVSAFLYAIADGVSLYFKVSKDVSMWTAGGLIGTSWKQLAIISPFIGIGLLVALLYSRQLTILSLNEEVAVGLGQKTTQIKLILFIVVILLAGASVAVIGNMAFVGLMVPHIVRTVVGTDYRHIIPMSIIVGGILMLFADTLGRTINIPFETPIAAIIAIMGLPFFLIIVRKRGGTFQ